MAETGLKKEILGYLEQIEEIISFEDLGKIDIKELHNILITIIGTANIGDYSVIGDTVIQLTHVLDGILNQRYDLSKEHIILLLITNEYIKEMLEKTRDELRKFSTDNILKAFEDISSELSVDIKDIYIKDIIRGKIQKKVNSDVVFNDSKEVSIPINRIDNMITGINNLILNQYQLKIKIKEISKLKELLSNVKDSGYSVDVDKAIRSFNNAETDIESQLLKFERTAFNLQEDVLSMRMLPLSFIKDEIENSINKLSKQFDKDISYNIDMEDIIIDKIILETIEEPILNIIKNSIEHGIGNCGNIRIQCKNEKGKIDIKISDDGGGVCYKSIRHKAMELFPFEKAKIAVLDDNELTSYLFLEGVTSVEDDNSRGFGLSQVNTKIKQIKGKLTLLSSESGVSLNLTVPKSLTTIFGYYITSGGEKFFVPSSFINEIITANRYDVIDLVSKQAIKLREDIVPIYPLAGILDNRDADKKEKMYILIIKIFGETIGIIVDEILYHASAIYKRLPGSIENLKELQGVVFDEEFKVVNILYIPTIINNLKAIRNIEFKERYSSEKEKYKRVLVVDDSKVNSDIIEKILIRENFSVTTAIDGIDALEKAREQFYDLIISDIKMPRMDGITFIENLRKESAYTESPVIFILSDEKEKIDFQTKANTTFFTRAQFNRDHFIKNVKVLLGTT